MKRFSYGERDYAFGQSMFTLRTSLGLTQAGLADLLGLSRRAVGGWEAGSSYPKAEHLKHVIELAVNSKPFLLDGRKRRSGRCGKRHARRCCSMSTGSPPCWVARVPPSSWWT